MRIKANLMISILLFSLIPIMLLNIFNKSKLTKAETDSMMNKIETTMQMQNQYLNSYFEQIIVTNRELSGQSYIKEYLNSVNSDSETENNENLLSVKGNTEICLENMYSSDQTIDNICLLDADGNVIYSAEKYYNAEVIAELAVQNENNLSNGFSEIFIDSDKAQPAAAFAYIKDVSDNDGNNAGRLVTIYNISAIQNIEKNTKIFQTSHIFFVDLSGNIMEFPYNFILNINETNKYDAPKSFIQKNIEDDKDSVNSFFTYTENHSEMVIYSSKISSSGWSFFMTISNDEYSAGIAKVKISMNIFALLVTVIVIVLVILYVNSQTKPISEMLHTLHKKQRGDKFVMFKVSASNEFAEISEAFNAMVDDISESEQRYRTIVEMSENIIFEYNLKKNIVRFSDNFNAKFSFRAKSEKYEDSFFVNCNVHSEDKSSYIKALNCAFRKSNYIQGEFRFKNIYGDYVWFLMRATMLYGRDESPFKIIGVMVDIDRAKSSELRLLQRANYDALTKLFNRETFEKRLVNAFELSSMRKERDAVLFIDLDDFKHFNDDYSHACGDEVLRFVASSITQLVESCGFAGRYGGDEFVICLTSQNSEEDSGAFAKSLIEKLQKGFYSQVINEHLSLNCSVGISFFSQSGNNIDTIVEEADEAMYSVKKNGKSNYAVYKKK
ncbi:MAG: diguanylate cyclase [Oscillospiraceae bacterium]